MKRIVASGVGVILVLAAAAAGAAVPPILNFQGRMLASDGTPEVGILSVGFAMYDAETGGTPLWSETQTVAFANGFYAVLLGTVSPFPASTLDDPRYLGVTIAGTELLPRMRVASVAFALRATVAEGLTTTATGTGSGLDADSVDGLDAVDFATAAHMHPPGDADTLDGIDSTGFALSLHTHAPGDADTLDGIDSTDFALSLHTHAPGDADTLDGIDSTGFATAAHGHAAAYVDVGGDTMTGVLTGPNQITGSLVGTVRVRGTGLNWAGASGQARNIIVDGADQAGNSRGLHVTTILRADHSVISNDTYDTHGSSVDADAMATYLDGLDDSVIVAIASYDAWTAALTPAARLALMRVGASSLAATIPTSCCSDLDGSRTAYALLGIPGSGTGAGIERWTPSGEGVAEFAALLVDGDMVTLGAGGPSVGFWSAYGSGIAPLPGGWTAIPGASVSFDLQRRSNVKMEYSMSLNASTNGNHCGVRFVVDGAGRGDATYGNSIVMGVSGTHWQSWADMNVEALGPGTHTVSLEGRTVNGGACNIDNADYARPWVAITAFPY